MAQLKKVEFDLNKASLRELAVLYGQERGQNAVGIPKWLQAYADIPAIEFFREDETGNSLAKVAFADALEDDRVTDSQIKTAVKTSRYLSNLLYRYTPKNAPERSFLLPSGDKPELAEDAFGLKEPPKAKSVIHVNPDLNVQKEFHKQLLVYAKENPADVPIVRSIFFGLYTGLRPSASSGLKFYQYYPDSSSLYIEADAKGAKTRAISVPLSPLADSMVQQAIKEQFPDLAIADSEGLTEGAKQQLAKNQIFKIKGKGGYRNLGTKDINRVLEKIKVPKLLFNSATREFYDTLVPEQITSSKRGANLFRNWHTANAFKIGVSPMVVSRAQGRTLQAKEIGSTGEQITYDSNVPGVVSSFERNEISKIESTFRPILEEVKAELELEFDLGTDSDLDVSRVVEGDPQIDAYFTRSVDSTLSLPKPPTDAEMDAKMGSFLDLLSKGGKLGVLGAVAGLSYSEGAQAVEKQGGGEELQVLGGVAQTAYDVVEPAFLFGATAEKVGDATLYPGKTEDQVSELLSDPSRAELGPRETDFTRELEVKKMDERQNTIDEQMNRITQYDKEMARNKPKADIEVTYPQGE